jgi:TDG/mug DNA glycosylase family protein
MILPDLLQHNLDIVFCGTAAGNKSAERKAYYAGAGNLFYPTLASCGFTPRILKPQEFPELLNYNIGLTDLVKHHFGMDKDLKEEHFDTKSFENKILNYQPKLVCFNGKEAARVYFNLKYTKQVNYGIQANTIGNTKLYVAPSTSLQAIAYWDESIWQQLKNLIN